MLDKTFLNGKILVCSHSGGWVGMRLGREGVACWIPWHRKQSQLFCIAGEKFKKWWATYRNFTLTSPSPAPLWRCVHGCTEVWVWNSREEEELAIASMTETSNWCWNRMKKITWKTEKVIMGRHRTVIKGAVPCIYSYPGVWHVIFICCFIESFLGASVVVVVFSPPHRQICVLCLLYHLTLDLWTSMLQWGIKLQFFIWNRVAFLEWAVLAVGTSSACKC